MTVQTFIKRTILLTALCFYGAATGLAQQFDYALHPRLDFTFNELALDLKISPDEHLLEGRAEYRLEANISGVDSLILQAAHMDIERVELDGEQAEFRLGNDSLFVALNSPAVAGRSHSLEVTYRSEPKFGVHFAGNRQVWSSFLPNSTRHWLPVVDHPRVRFTTDITLTVPENLSALAPGRKRSEEIGDAGEKRVRFVSNRTVPATALWFAAGAFQTAETTIGVKRITVSTGAGEEMRGHRQDLLEEAYASLDRVQDVLGHEYPYEVLHVAMLEDSRWETKSYGAGGVFLFRNQRDLGAQLRRGIYAQWYGVHLREERWSDAEAMNLHQTAIHDALSGEMAIIEDEVYGPEPSVNPYYEFSLKNWNRWQRFYRAWEDSAWKKAIEEQLDRFPALGESVMNWVDFADYWYERSGQPWFSPPDIVEPETDGGRKDSVIYDVEYRYDELEGDLELRFRARDSVVTELVTVPLVEHAGGETDTLQVTFTGARDTVRVNLSPSVSYASLRAGAREDLHLVETLPVPFLLNRMRNGESPEIRAGAARQLGRHSNNPDLQLAIMDLLSRESEPVVKAALYRSLGEITRGAEGTEQIFLDALEDEESPVIRQAVLSSLSSYRDNDRVSRTLRSHAVNSDSIDTFRIAARSFMAAADSASILEFSREVAGRDTAGYRSIYLLEEMVRRETAAPDMKQLELLAGTEYPYSVRSRALALLAAADAGGEGWSTRIVRLLGDNDPRIRFEAVRTAAEIGLSEAESIFQERLLDEYDGRVFHEMSKYLSD